MTDPSADPTSTMSEPDREQVAEVRELIVALLKAVRARQTYVEGNPLIEKFIQETAGRFASLFETVPQIALTVDEGRLLWNDVEVYEKPIGPENVAFRFFKDGIRWLVFLPGVEDRELPELVGILAHRKSPDRDEDILAQLWRAGFETIRMEYVNVSEDEGELEVPTSDRSAGEGETLEDLSEIEDVLAGGPVPEEEEDELAAILLGEPDLAYLTRELEAEWQRPLVRDVVLGLLDQFELRDQDRRRQVVDIVRALLPRLLADRDYPNVALLLNELQLLANKTGDEDTQELVTSLLRDMSEAVAELVSGAGVAGEAPEQEDMAALLGALQADAIPTLVRAIPAITSARARRQLTEALDRLVAGYPDQVRELLRSEDPVLAAEAARIVGRLRIAEAEPDLVALFARPEMLTRQAAIEALTEIGSVAGTQALGEALEDGNREVRLAAMKSLATLKPEGADRMLRRWLAPGVIAGRDKTEQMALLKAYASVAGEDAVSVLSRLLHGRRFPFRRHPPTVRAAAARALGLLDSEVARQALSRARDDRNAPVRSAARSALRAASERQAPGEAGE
ncbi:MAG: HEAT repeat domain-containing protein [Gemmatimonadota bacterium]